MYARSYFADGPAWTSEKSDAAIRDFVDIDSLPSYGSLDAKKTMWVIRQALEAFKGPGEMSWLEP